MGVGVIRALGNVGVNALVEVAMQPIVCVSGTISTAVGSTGPCRIQVRLFARPRSEGRQT